MKIAVCVKYVPVISRIGFDYENKTIIREGVPSEINPFDVLALVKSLEIKEFQQSEIVAISMGPPQAKEGLIQCLALGADRAILLSDRAFAGSDTLATSRALSLLIKRESPDIILCGRNSADAETGQVGPELAELLDIPHVSQVTSIDLLPDGTTAIVGRTTEEGSQKLECPLPALFCVTEGIAPERFAKHDDIEKAQLIDIEEVNCAGLGVDESLFGIEGSPTWVEDIRMVEPDRLAEIITDHTPESAANIITKGIRQRLENLMQSNDKPDTTTQMPRFPSNQEKSIWVISESYQKQIRQVSFEMLGKARELSEFSKSEVVAVSIAPTTNEMISDLGRYGADRVLTLDNSELGPISSRIISNTLGDAIKRANPYAVLFPATPDGRDLASRISARMNLGLTGDAIDLEINQEGQLVQLKPALGGNVIAPILSKTRPNMVTIRPGLLTPSSPDNNYQPTHELINPSEFNKPDITLLHTSVEEELGTLLINQSEIVVGVGMGVESPENIEKIKNIAWTIGAPLATTRNVVHQGWLPHQVQVGISGRSISPIIYIAVGIRGAFNHTVGIQKAGIIISINKNQRAPIFKASDYGIVGEWENYIGPLVDSIKLLLESLNHPLP
ncbi:MAG: FAD-binding protein [Chloroflexota bacterium]|nr:FAD-binding protein [Chloroflexota bacterium]